MGSVAGIIGRNSFNKFVRKMTWGKLADTLKHDTDLLLRPSDRKGVLLPSALRRRLGVRIISRFCYDDSISILQFPKFLASHPKQHYSNQNVGLTNMLKISHKMKMYKRCTTQYSQNHIARTQHVSEYTN